MSFLERVIFFFLKGLKVEFEMQKRFNFIGRKSLDFYLPKYKLAIECQGLQHYKKSGIFGDFKTQLKRDVLKESECNKNGIKIIYYTDYKYKKLVPSKFKKNTVFNLYNLKEKINNGI